MRRMMLSGSMKFQRGIAMITAMMITAIAVTVIASIYVQQRYSIRLTNNFQDLEQAYQYAYAAEEMASAWLKRDFKETPEHDSLHDFWAQTDLPPFEIDDDDGQQIGEMIVQMEDMQGYLNLNNLLIKKKDQQKPLMDDGTPNPSYNKDDPELNKPHEAMMNAFARLFQNTGIPAEYRYSILDWIDPDDSLADPSSAETADYLTMDPAYRASNALLTDPSELQLIRMGMVSDPKQHSELLENVLPLVSALPTPTSININTALPEVLIAVGLSPSQATMAQNLRKAGPITNLSELKQNIQNVDGDAVAVLGVASNYFRLSGQVKLGKSRLFLNSLLFRSPKGEVRVIMRRFSRVAKPKPQTTNLGLTS